jgi:hypothetical protein
MRQKERDKWGWGEGEKNNHKSFNDLIPFLFYRQYLQRSQQNINKV